MAILVLNGMEILASSGVFGHIKLIDIEKGDFHTAIGEPKGDSTIAIHIIPSNERNLAWRNAFDKVLSCYLSIRVNPHFLYNFKHRLHFGFGRRIEIFPHFKIGINIVIGYYNVVRLLKIVVDISI